MLDLNYRINLFSSDYVIQLILRDFSERIREDLLAIANKTENGELALIIEKYFK